MESQNNVIAVYLRLSEEDNDVGSKDSLKEESNSIANQRKLVNDYLKRHKEFAPLDTLEYCDDGYSGTNFDRPGFQRMISDASVRKIGIIILKDYSRLGRNFLGVGHYLEEVFPELEMRVISINDGYDSKNVMETSDGISIPMKNLINDYYVKDLSKKVKSAVHSRQKKGEFISPYAIFGYKKAPTDKHKLIIDEETAPIVKLIFKYALDGLNGSNIARKLNGLEIFTPAEYSNSNRHRKYVIDDKTVWTSPKVLKIIRDQRYAGDMISNVRVRTKIAKQESERVNRDEWIIVKGTHEGIVSKEIYWKVNNDIMPLTEKETILLGDFRRKGFYYCADCGRLLRRSHTTINPYYECARSRYTEDRCSEIKVYEKDMMSTMVELIQDHIKLLCHTEKLIRDLKQKIYQENKTEMTVSDADNAINKLMQTKMNMYERYRLKSISKDEYVLRKKQLTMQIEELEERKLKICNGIGDKEESKILERKLSDLIEKYKNVSVFSDEVMNDLIDKVIVYSEDRIEIKWKYQTEFEDMLLQLLEGVV